MAEPCSVQHLAERLKLAIARGEAAAQGQDPDTIARSVQRELHAIGVFAIELELLREMYEPTTTTRTTAKRSTSAGA
jgi:hypothetical protein